MPADVNTTDLDTADLDTATELDGADAHEELSAVELGRLTVERFRSTKSVSSVELRELMIDVESLTRQLRAVSVDLLGASEDTALHRSDGHTSAKVMMRHVDNLSGGEALARDRCRKMFADLTDIAYAYRTGTLGTDHVDLLARVYANVRVSGAMGGRQTWFLKLAAKHSFKRFQERLLEWQRLIDEDGPEPPGVRNARNRRARFSQDPIDLGWELNGFFTSLDGATNNDIHQAFIKMLFDADWAEAKARVGDTVCVADLSRTHAQRSADAMTMIFATAAANGPIATTAFNHTVVWSASAYEEMARRFAGAKPRQFDIDDYRCETIAGDRLDPTEAFANSVLNKIRRLVIDAKSIPVDQGTARSFTGLTRDAIRIAGRECFWIGCWLPATKCQTDHLHDHAKGGRTNADNGAPACGTHNQAKQNGYTVVRDEHGTIRIYRPDGSEIE